MLKTLRLLALLPLLLASLARAEDHDRWYVVEMAGQRAGWMHTWEKTEGEQITTGSDMKLSIKRGAVAVDILIDSQFLETKAGKPVSASTTMTMASTPNRTEYLFKGDEVEVVSGTGAAQTRVTQPLPEGVWLTPAAAAEFTRKRLEADAKEFTVRILDVSSGVRAVTTSRKVEERTTVEAMGKVVPAIKWITTNDFVPDIQSVEYVDERGTTVRSEVDLGGIKMTMLLADKDLALAEVDAPELMASTLVRPKGTIDEPRTLRKASYLLTIGGPRLADLPAGGPQRTERVSDKSIRVTIDLDNPAAADAADEGLLEYREPSQMIGSTDEVVRRLTRDALKGVKDDDHEARVEALRTAVFRHIKNKSFGVGFASAAEVARTCEGDCSEHAALLTAMLRSAGYAARTASGLLFVDEFAGQQGVFGYHMWSQVLLTRDGVLQWVDLDATIPARRGGGRLGRNGFDATHITLAVSSLADGESINGMVALAPLIGNLEITVE